MELNIAPSKIFYELTPEQLKAVATEAALKALELARQQNNQWLSLPEILNTRQAAIALGMSISTFKRRVREGFIPAHYERVGGHPYFKKTEIKEIFDSGFDTNDY